MYASAQSLDFLAWTKKLSFSNRKPIVSHPGFRMETNYRTWRKIYMQKVRIDDRQTFDTKCTLDINGTKYKCQMDNLSTAGASIEMKVSDCERVKIGEMGTLTVTLLTNVDYPCKVVRINSTQISLQFIEVSHQ